VNAIARAQPTNNTGKSYTHPIRIAERQRTNETVETAIDQDLRDPMITSSREVKNRRPNATVNHRQLKGGAEETLKEVHYKL